MQLIRHSNLFIAETIVQGGVVLEEEASALNQEERIGRPYRRDIGVQEECRWFLCMNPLQSALLSDTEFLEMDVTFDSCRDFPYLLNITRFSYNIMQCKYCYVL